MNRNDNILMSFGDSRLTSSAGSSPPESSAAQLYLEAQAALTQAQKKLTALGKVIGAGGILEGHSGTASRAPLAKAPQLEPTGPPAPLYSVIELARAFRLSKKTILRKARREGWIGRLSGNKFLFIPPAQELLKVSKRLPRRRDPIDPYQRVKFTDLVSEAARAKVLARQRAVERFMQLRQLGYPVEQSLAECVKYFAIGDEGKPFVFSITSLRRWVRDFSILGLNGLVDQKLGAGGRRPGVAMNLPRPRRRRRKARKGGKRRL